MGNDPNDWSGFTVPEQGEAPDDEGIGNGFGYGRGVEPRQRPERRTLTPEDLKIVPGGPANER